MSDINWRDLAFYVYMVFALLTGAFIGWYDARHSGDGKPVTIVITVAGLLWPIFWFLFLLSILVERWDSRRRAK